MTVISDHPRYAAATTDYDLSLLHLSGAVDYGRHRHIRPVCLPEAGTEYMDGEELIVSGW